MGMLTALFNPGTYLIAAIVALVMGGYGWWTGHSGKAEAVAAAAKAAQIEGFNEATDLAFEQFAKDQAIVKKQLAKQTARRIAAEDANYQLEVYRATNPPSYAAACNLDDERLRIIGDAVAGRSSNAGGIRAAVPAPGAASGADAGGVRPNDGGKPAPAPRLRGPSGLDVGVPGGAEATQ